MDFTGGYVSTAPVYGHFMFLLLRSSPLRSCSVQVFASNDHAHILYFVHVEQNLQCKHWALGCVFNGGCSLLVGTRFSLVPHSMCFGQNLPALTMAIYALYIWKRTNNQQLALGCVFNGGCSLLVGTRFSLVPHSMCFGPNLPALTMAIYYCALYM